jgi:hypothetical protein
MARLDAHERAWLTCGGVHETATVWLNGEVLGRQEGTGPFEFEVGKLLRPRNELLIDVEAADGDGGMDGLVALVVRASAFLRNVKAWLTSEDDEFRMHVAGEVVGMADRPLDLYVLAAGSTVAYTTVQAAPEGTPFQVVADQQALPNKGGAARLDELRVELINGATVWDTWSPTTG